MRRVYLSNIEHRLFELEIQIVAQVSYGGLRLLEQVFEAHHVKAPEMLQFLGFPGGAAPQLGYREGMIVYPDPERLIAREIIGVCRQAASFPAALLR